MRFLILISVFLLSGSPEDYSRFLYVVVFSGLLQGWSFVAIVVFYLLKFQKKNRYLRNYSEFRVTFAVGVCYHKCDHSFTRLDGILTGARIERKTQCRAASIAAVVHLYCHKRKSGRSASM